MLKAAGPEGIAKVINGFVTVAHPLFSKRQVEIKIGELAVKEKRPEDQYKVWHIKDEYAHFLEAPGPNGYAPVVVAVAAKAPKVKEEKGTTSTAAAVGAGGSSKATPSKRKRDTSEEGEEEAAAAAAAAAAAGTPSAAGAGSASKEPKRFKRAFGFFVKAKRAEAEELRGDDAAKTDALRRRHLPR